MKNSPLNYTDPSGHKACDEVGADGECYSHDDEDIGDIFDDDHDDRREDDSGGSGKPLLKGFFANPPPPGFPPSPFACEWLDCALSAVSTLATGVALATIEVPQISGFAFAVDVVATVWAMMRTESDYIQGEISNTRRLALHITGGVGLLPTSAGLGLSVVNTIFTFSGHPK